MRFKDFLNFLSNFPFQMVSQLLKSLILKLYFRHSTENLEALAENQSHVI